MPDSVTGAPGQVIDLAEATPTTGAALLGDAQGARIPVLLIRAGWGTSGYYSESLLKRDGPAAWPVGTQMFGDHATAEESYERPEGSIHGLLSEIVTTPRWSAKHKGLIAEADIFPQAEGILNPKFRRRIGLSIRASGTAEQGEAEGRKGSIITAITEGVSVDWVTKAGAGGRVLDLLEASRKVPLHEAHGMTANDLRNALSAAVEEKYGDDYCTWAYVTDYGDDFVIYRLSGRDCDPGLYRQGYTVDTAGTAALTGDPVEVNTQTTYVPRLPEPVDITATETDPPAAPAVVQESTNTQKEGTVAEPTTQTGAPPAGGGSTDQNLTEAERARMSAMESEIAQLREGARLRSDSTVRLVEANKTIDGQGKRIAQLEAIEDARAAVAEVFAESGLPEVVQGKVTAAVLGLKGAYLPLTESGQVDMAKVKANAATAIKEETDYLGRYAESVGFGGVRGFGAPQRTDSGEVTDAMLAESAASIFGPRPVLKGA